ncbi:MAG: LemA family protein [Hydrogenibacillus schlegelii]|nr:LemA family protein [Hydrogenibacillus schlegelii]
MSGRAIGLALLLVVAVFAIVTFSAYNGLVQAEEAVNAAWSQVENQLQRRADLIPNLVATVKGYAAHEEDLFTRVAEARARLAGAAGVAETEQAAAALDGALGRLLAIAENYPNLKADANFRQLADELAGTENRLAVARMDYNDAVRRYNSLLRRFPNHLIGRLFGFEPRSYFQGAAGTETPPAVDFGR